MSVRTAQREIDSREFAEWIAFDRISPLEPKRADIRTAMQCQVIAMGAGAKNAQIKDFVPDWVRSGGVVVRESWSSVLGKLRAVTGRR